MSQTSGQARSGQEAATDSDRRNSQCRQVDPDQHPGRQKIARVGDKPAITTCPQQIDLRNGILLSDTPGLLWPVLDDMPGACRLAASGAIGDNAFDTIEVGLTSASYLAERYPAMLMQRYKLKEIPQKQLQIVETIGRKRGCLVSGGDIDLHRAAELLLRDLRAGKLGRVSLERPAETNSAFDRGVEPIPDNSPEV